MYNENVSILVKSMFASLRKTFILEIHVLDCKTIEPVIRQSFLFRRTGEAFKGKKERLIYLLHELTTVLQILDLESDRPFSHARLKGSGTS